MTRTPIPNDVETAVLRDCRRRCALCYGLDRDASRKQGQIAHIDHDASNAAVDNLVFLCLHHHDEYDSRTSQSKGLTVEEVRHFKRELLHFVARAFEQPAQFGVVDVPPADNITGHWICESANDRSDLRIEWVAEGQIKVRGAARHNIHSEWGPNIGNLEFEADIVNGEASFEDKDSGYKLTLRFSEGRVRAREKGSGPFGLGCHFTGEYRRPYPRTITIEA